MSTSILSSGDLTADRRADFAAMLAADGDPEAAADLMGQALELAPDWAAGWFLRGGYLEIAGLEAPAIAAYRMVVKLAPDDMFGASLRLALLGEIQQPDVPPSSFIERLFDDYAERFDEALVDRLDYSVPGKLADLLLAYAGGDHIFETVVDLGCGTGLFGKEISRLSNNLEGYDLSANMLSKADEKQYYTLLGLADLSLPPESCGLFDRRPRHRADLVSAADVLMYLGNLEAAFANVDQLIRPGGHFAFSVEKASEATGFELCLSLRYAHSRAHVEGLLTRHGMKVAAMEETVIRTDAGNPIIGLLFVAIKLPPSTAEMLG